MTRPVVLVVLDGYGLGTGGDDDATAVAHAPFFARLRAEYPHAAIETSGEAVGLPPGQMGNSEVGHMTLGAGRIIEQDITRIDHAIERGELARNPAIAAAVEAAKAGRGTLHLMGLLSDGGVHSHLRDLEALLDHCAAAGAPVALHAFLDGRDTPPRSGLAFVRGIVPRVEVGGGHVATVTGRYFAMDRDRRWDRVERAYRAMVLREGEPAPDAVAAVQAAYDRGEGDEFVAPTVVDGGAPIRDGDAVICFNFRADRAREITNRLTRQKPDLYAEVAGRSPDVDLATYVCFTEYDKSFDLPVAFPSVPAREILAERIAAAGLSQFRIAETEKYAHVTFFFNSGREEPFANEERLLIPSPRDVPTYDHKPEMSAHQVTDALIDRLRRADDAFVLVNFANPDMVGHTGVLAAAVKAVETIDGCLQRIADAVLEAGGTLLVTADHGNCEQMYDPKTDGPHTAHTTNPVPLYWVSAKAKGRHLRDGGLADLAPTVLELLGLPRPDAMTGRSLIAGG